MAWRQRYRASLVLSLFALSLLGCAGEEDGLGIVGKPKASTAPANGSVTGGDPNNGQNTGASPTPSPSPSPKGPVLPAGFEVNSDFSTGSVPIVRPQAIGISVTGDVWVASAPMDSRDLNKPYLMTVMNGFGNVKATASLAILPKAIAFYKPTGASALTFFTEGRNLVTMDASLSVVAEVEYNTGSPSTLSSALSVTYPGRPGLVKAIATPNQVTIYPMDYPASGTPDERDFPGSVAALACGYYGNTWAAGSQKLVKLPPTAGGTPIETSVTDLGTLKSVAVHSNEDVWVLGTEKLALYGTDGVRKAGPFNYGGDQVLLRTGNKPVVVNYETGTITRLNTDGTPDTTGQTGMSAVTLPGGLNGAALDTNGNLWVSSKTQDYVAKTRF